MATELNDDVWAEVAFDTLAVRAGVARTNEGEHSEALFLTSSFVFDSAAHAAARFGGSEAGNIYSRFTNPTVRTFEQRLAALEGGERAVATSSGMAAILATALAFLAAGDHVVCSRAVFGTTNVLFEKYLKKYTDTEIIFQLMYVPGKSSVTSVFTTWILAPGVFSFLESLNVVADDRTRS